MESIGEKLTAVIMEKLEEEDDDSSERSEISRSDPAEGQVFVFQRTAFAEFFTMSTVNVN